MKIIHRYQRDTIRNQVWEITLVDGGDVITMYKTHFRKDGYEVIKEVKEAISRKVMERYMEKNHIYHLETYTTDDGVL
jgi:isocitrate dehydrogenase